MSQTRLSVRHANKDDFRDYAGGLPPVEWSICPPIGYVAERDGRSIALGAVTWDAYGRAWGWFHMREPLPAFVTHRKAREMIVLLREVGEPALYVFCSTVIAGADKWLRRLGFAPRPEMTTDPNRPVWSCDLST